MTKTYKLIKKRVFSDTTKAASTLVTGIECLICGRVSWNHNDVEKRYCGWCHQFHDIMEQEGQHDTEGNDLCDPEEPGEGGE